MIYSLTPSDKNFHTILMCKGILAIFFVKKKLVRWNNSYLQCALRSRKTHQRIKLVDLIIFVFECGTIQTSLSAIKSFFQRPCFFCLVSNPHSRTFNYFTSLIRGCVIFIVISLFHATSGKTMSIITFSAVKSYWKKGRTGKVFVFFP